MHFNNARKENSEPCDLCADGRNKCETKAGITLLYHCNLSYPKLHLY